MLTDAIKVYCATLNKDRHHCAVRSIEEEEEGEEETFHSKRRGSAFARRSLFFRRKRVAAPPVPQTVVHLLRDSAPRFDFSGLLWGGRVGEDPRGSPGRVDPSLPRSGNVRSYLTRLERGGDFVHFGPLYE